MLAINILTVREQFVIFPTTTPLSLHRPPPPNMLSLFFTTIVNSETLLSIRPDIALEPVVHRHRISVTVNPRRRVGVFGHVPFPTLLNAFLFLGGEIGVVTGRLHIPLTVPVISQFNGCRWLTDYQGSLKETGVGGIRPRPHQREAFVLRFFYGNIHDINYLTSPVPNYKWFLEGAEDKEEEQREEQFF